MSMADLKLEIVVIAAEQSGDKLPSRAQPRRSQ